MFASRTIKSLILLLCSGITPLAMAQSISGDLVVKVSDSSNAAVAGAKLILTATDTNIKTESATDNEGTSLFPQLKPGRSPEMDCAIASGAMPEQRSKIRDFMVLDANIELGLL